MTVTVMMEVVAVAMLMVVAGVLLVAQQSLWSACCYELVDGEGQLAS